MNEQTITKPEIVDETAISSAASARTLRLPSIRKQTGLARLLGISGVLMSLALPIGIIPRVLQAQELDKTNEKEVSLLPAVALSKVVPAPSFRKISLPGTVEGVVETAVYARTNGYVDKRVADIGDRVAAGQLLAHIETPEIDLSEKEAQAQVLTNVAGKAQSVANRDRAQADLDRAIANLSQARSNLVESESDQKFAQSSYMRWKQLGEDGAVSAQDVDEKETKLKTTSAAKEAAKDRIRAAQSEVVAARARLEAEGANVNVNSANITAAIARADRSNTEKLFQNVVSPFTGVITERNVDTGTLITSGSENSKLALYRIARIDTVKVFVDVPQFASSGVKVGQTVEVSLKEIPSKIFTGKVARTSVALDPVTRTLRTEIHVANKELELAPGMYADVNFAVPRTNEVVLIPANSLISRGDGQKVALVDSGKKVHYRKIQTGYDLGTEIEVVNGLKASDSVIINPSDSLAEGAQVAIEK